VEVLLNLLIGGLLTIFGIAFAVLAIIIAELALFISIIYFLTFVVVRLGK
jgi:hypothetical protein